jgi:hypothetical protein
MSSPSLRQINIPKWQAIPTADAEAIDGILDHLKTLDGRTRKSETAITRLNLIVFGVGGPVSLAVLGVVLKLWLKA